ncbi:MAG: glycosyltransferase family 4 protein [Acidobacteria bacterium]|nr:glycosyltransferase family 4 protein [Acidobacteriota bacterium]
MKIAYVITRADAVGGASIHVRDLAGAMLARGHEVLVLLGGDGPVTELLKSAGVPFRALPCLQRSIHPLRDARALGEMISVMREVKPDLVSTHTAKAGFIGRAASARLGVRAIYTAHGWSIGSRMPAPLSTVFTVAERVASRWTDAIICVCEYEKRLALEKRVASAEKLHVVYNGACDIPASLRAHPGVAPVRICSVARFEAPKDHVTLLHALARLRPQSWELELIGDGPLQPGIRRLAGELGLSGRIRFSGYQRDPAPALAAAQVFVLSSRSEGFPRSVLEAMRTGLPVVASDVGGVGEAVKNGGTGLLVPGGNPEALAAALGELLGAASERQRMGAAARAAYESRFRLETMVENTVAIYATVLKRAAISEKRLG